jgi:hypothetical protein
MTACAIASVHGDCGDNHDENDSNNSFAKRRLWPNVLVTTVIVALCRDGDNVGPLEDSWYEIPKLISPLSSNEGSICQRNGVIVDRTRALAASMRLFRVNK